ncbi:MAG: hypothetical protein IKV94_03210 [Clostridia bacterium]|nr:hypothetical protein [Clostridia bacterium]
MYIASLIFGIIALITSWIPFFGLAVTVISLIITIIAFCVKKPNGKGMRIAGLVLTLIALVISGFMTYSVFMLADANEELLKEASEAKLKSDLSNAKFAVSLAYAQGLANGQSMNNGLAYTSNGELMVAEDYYEALVGLEGDNLNEVKTKYKITVSVPGGAPNLEAK